MKHSGLVQVYLGEKKYINLVTLGLALRASGHKMKTIFFWLDEPEFTIPRELTSVITSLQQLSYEKICQYLKETNRSIIIIPNGLDYFSEKQIINLVKNKKNFCELIITGKKCSQSLLDKASLVTKFDLINKD